MSMYNKINVASQSVSIGMDAFFTRGLDVALIAAIVNIDNNNIIGRERIIRSAARSDNELSVRNSCAYVLAMRPVSSSL